MRCTSSAAPHLAPRLGGGVLEASPRMETVRRQLMSASKQGRPAARGAISDAAQRPDPLRVRLEPARQLTAKAMIAANAVILTER